MFRKLKLGIAAAGLGLLSACTTPEFGSPLQPAGAYAPIAALDPPAPVREVAVPGGGGNSAPAAARSFVEEVSGALPRKGLPAAIESYTRVSGKEDGIEAALAAKRGPGYAQEGLSLRTRPGEALPIGVWVRGYGSQDLKARERAEGGRLYLDVPVGGWIAQVDGRWERSPRDRLEDYALGLEQDGTILKLGRTQFNDKELWRVWGNYKVEVGDRAVILAAGANQAPLGTIYRFMLEEHPKNFGDKDGFRVLAILQPAADSWEVSALYAFSARSPVNPGLATSDRTNNWNEPRANGNLKRAVAPDAGEYRVKPFIENDVLSRLAVLEARYAEQAGAREWHAGGIVYPAGVLGIDAGALNGFYRGGKVHGTDRARLLGEVGSIIELGEGVWLIGNVEKEEHGPVRGILRLEVKF